MQKSSYNILGVRVDNLTLDEVLEKIKKCQVSSIKCQEKNRKTFHIVTVNPEFVILAQKNLAFKTILNRASLSVPDGIGISLAGVLTGQRFKERITGVRLMEELCYWAAKEGLTVGLIGGKPKIAIKTLECLKQKYSGFSGWTEERPQIEARGSKKFPISNSKLRTTDILFVAMGAPKQEFFIKALAQGSSSQRIILSEDHPLIAVGVGGAFDELAGLVRPVPAWVESLGFKWFWRLIQEPWRWRRQLRLLEFVYLVFSERLKRLFFPLTNSA